MNVKRCKTITCTSVLFLLLFIGAAFMAKGVGQPASTGESEKPRETLKRKRQDRIGRAPLIDTKFHEKGPGLCDFKRGSGS